MKQSKLKTPAAGANAERQAIKTKVRRMIKQVESANEEMDGPGVKAYAHPVLQELLRWIEGRDERYNKRPGGLGKVKR